MLQEFGLDPDAALDLFQSSRSIFGADPDIIDAAIYIKYDRSFAGHLVPGAPVPANITLSTVDGKSTKLLSDFFNPPRPLILVGGSHS